ncbi:MAG: phosphopantothenate/pantothenate synthetase [Candidatus Bathyarchaeota archaeon]
MTEIELLKKHPRAESLQIRATLIKAYKEGIVASAGLIAHGRGETFDYILGEKTQQFALKAEKIATAMLLTSRHPVISVNGNAVALCGMELVKLANLTNAKLEVNLFYRSNERVAAIEKRLNDFGASDVLGVDMDAQATIHEVMSHRRNVDPRGILIADCVFVPLEDGDRATALRKMGKKVLAVDLNPFSRTSRQASVTIVDNIVRALPKMVEEAETLRLLSPYELHEMILYYDNEETLTEVTRLINSSLMSTARGNSIPGLANSEVELFEKYGP